MRKSRAALAVVICVAILVLTVPGCGDDNGETNSNGTEGRPESVTVFEAVEYTKPAADKWQENNWMIQVRDGDPLGRDGKAKIWEVYYFSPRPEEDSRMFVIYNRGNVWPNAPGKSKGGEEGLEIYRENQPPDFRVDSPEAYTVALRNGGGEYMDGHPDARPHATLRCKADYDAVGEDMPAPKYKWIWDIYYKEPRAGVEVLHILVDGMTGEFITKELVQPPS